MVDEVAESMANAFTGISGRRLGAVPLISVHVALVPPLATTPRQTWAVPKPDITIVMVLLSPGRGAISQIHRAGNGAACSDVAVQVPPLFTTRYTSPTVVAAYMRLELT